MRVLEDESRSRLGRFNQKDVSMVFSSVMRLHPSSPHPLVESCLSSLERHLEKERHPQTLFLLLSYYRLRAQALQGHPASDQQLINNRKILRLVRHTLGQVSAMREHELALLDEMLALCAQEANNKALEAIFSSQLFYENRQERFIRSMAGRDGGPAGCQPHPGALSVRSVALEPLLQPQSASGAVPGPAGAVRSSRPAVLAAGAGDASAPPCRRPPHLPLRAGRQGQRAGSWGGPAEPPLSPARWGSLPGLPGCAGRGSLGLPGAR